ncbi:MAG: hypothetical protein R3Y15_01265, partial [Rikenellaceae bacterium]
MFLCPYKDGNRQDTEQDTQLDKIPRTGDTQSHPSKRQTRPSLIHCSRLYAYSNTTSDQQHRPYSFPKLRAAANQQHRPYSFPKLRAAANQQLA